VVVAVSVDRHQRTAHLSALGGAAATAGLGMAAHVAAIAEPDRSCAPAALGDGHPVESPAAGDDGGAWPANPHTDLLIFKAVGDDA
jgi:hypothetical protein